MQFKITPSKRTLVILIFACAVISIFCVLTYCNRAARLSELQAQVNAKQSVLSDSQRTVRKLASVEEEYTDDQAKLAVLETGVSTKDYVPTLLKQMEQLGQGVNLCVTGVRPKAPDLPKQAAKSGTTDSSADTTQAKKPDPYDKLDMDIEVTGKYWDVVRLLRSVTSFPKIIGVNSIQIAPVAGSTGIESPELSVKLGVTAFILKDSALPASVQGS